MEADWRALCESGFHVEGIDGFSLSFEPALAGKLLSLARELAALQVPPLYRMQLLEVFSAFDRHLERVVELLRPIAAVLPDYMAPWTRQIPALAEQWDTFFRETRPRSFSSSEPVFRVGEFRELRLAFRFFFSLWLAGEISW